MIWPEIMPWLLAVVLFKQRVRRWVDIHCSPACLKRFDFAHYRIERPLMRYRKKSVPYYIMCTCPWCMLEFKHFFEWRRIG